MIKAFKKENRVLLAELVRTDFKLRYQGSVLGYTWSLLRPLLMFLILYIVFANFLKLGDEVPNYPIYLLLGIVLWQFFADMTNQGLGSIVERGDLIRKIQIPRWIVVLSTSMSALINLGLNLIVVTVFIIISKTTIPYTVIWLPLLLLEIYILGVALSLLLSALFVKYRDISYIWEVVVQAGFYATPILYPLSLINNITYQKLLLLNPMAQSIQDARYVLVTNHTITINSVYGSNLYRLLPISVCFILLVVGVIYFKKEAKDFAENI